jgi:predicted nucleotidyltransferase
MENFGIEVESLRGLCERNGVVRLAVFGSVARGETTASSDVDLLVRFRDRKSLLEVVVLERELGETMARKVDLLTEGAISPYLRDRVLQEARVIDEAGRFGLLETHFGRDLAHRKLPRSYR